MTTTFDLAEAITEVACTPDTEVSVELMASIADAVLDAISNPEGSPHIAPGHICDAIGLPAGSTWLECAAQWVDDQADQGPSFLPQLRAAYGMEVG